MRSAPVSRDHGQNAAPVETFEQIIHHAPRVKKGMSPAATKVSGWPLHGEAGLHTGQWAKSTRSLAGDVSDAFEPLPAISDHEYFLAEARKRVSDTFDQGHTLDLQG